MSPFTVRPGTPDLNAGGVEPEVSKRLVEREPEPHEIPILMALREVRDLEIMVLI
jgi:hypothetical protein